MIIGIGKDLVEVDRVERLLEAYPGRAGERLFSGRNQEYCRGKRRHAETVAARFAAKEAFFESWGTGLAEGASWRKVEVVTGGGGAPRLHLDGATRRLALQRGVQRAPVTLTHAEGIAGACVVLEGVLPAADPDAPHGNGPEALGLDGSRRPDEQDGPA